MTLYPMRLHPCYKSQIWGGDKLKKQFNKTDAPLITGESWELASLPNGDSIVDDGIYEGYMLTDLEAIDHDSFWGSKCPKGQFPVLIKLIDANKDLSIQVHPSKDTAIEENGEHAKFEMWYIVEADPQSFIYYGLKQYMTRDELPWRAENGTICEVLNKVPVHKGDVFYVLPGTIHAIGAGIVIAEIQQSSDTTFRLYDYGRLDAYGKPRELHLDRGTACADVRPITSESCRAINGIQTSDFTLTEMFLCEFFKAYCIDVRQSITLNSSGISFQHILCVEGSGTIQFDGKDYSLDRGDSFFIPAALGKYVISGNCRVLFTKL